MKRDKASRVHDLQSGGENAMPMRRKVANQTEAQFKNKARDETFAASPVDGSLDRMAGNSQKTAGRHGKVRREIAKKARSLSRMH